MELQRLAVRRGSPLQGVRLPPYPTMLTLGMALGVACGCLFAASAGLPVDRAYFAYVVLLIPALLGARLLHVLKHWRHYRARPRLILSRNDAGLALYGGLALALLVSWPLLAALELAAGPFWDGAAVVILVGMALTKVGCHLHGCCAGRPTTSQWGVNLRRDRGRVRRTPAQFLESGLALMLLAVLVPAAPYLGFSGALFWWASLGYGTGRFFLEGMRESFDPRHVLNSNRIMSIALAGCAVTALILGSR